MIDLDVHRMDLRFTLLLFVMLGILAFCVKPAHSTNEYINLKGIVLNDIS
tara:strand:- start:464 stop:613 length:150 start_codon:yes stop_codon:yes gene_type:complete